MAYNVYTAEELGNGPRNHIEIFVESESDGSGRLFHVTGNLLQGMTYETRQNCNPTQSPVYIPDTMTLIGTVNHADMARFEAVCEAVEVPGAQLLLNGRQKDPGSKLRRCGEWVQDVKDKLVGEGIVVVV